MGDDNAGIVDHAPTAGAVHVLEGFGKEDPGFKPREPRIVLNEDLPAVSQGQACALGRYSFPVKDQWVWRRVVLHLFARCKGSRGGPGAAKADHFAFATVEDIPLDHEEITILARFACGYTGLKVLLHRKGRQPPARGGNRCPATRTPRPAPG